MNPWTSLAVLLSLAAAADKLPSALTPFLSPAGPKTDPVLKISIDPAAGFNEVDPEAAQILHDALPRVEVLANPLLGRLRDASRTAAPEIASWKTAVARKAAILSGGWSSRAGRGAWGVLGTLVAASFLFLSTGLKGFGRLTGDVLLGACRGAVLLLSVLGAGIHAVTGLLPWAFLPPALWASLLAGMLLGALILRAVDLNHPVWNRLVSGFAAPLAACAFTVIWARAVGRPLF